MKIRAVTLRLGGELEVKGNFSFGEIEVGGVAHIKGNCEGNKSRLEEK